MRVQVLVFDGFDELDVFGVFEPLAMAGCETAFTSLYEQDFVTAAYGTKIVPSHLLDIARKPDLLIVPGGGWITRAERGAWAECKKGLILERLKQFHGAGVTLASVCTGSLLLGNAGLLQQRPATTNHAAVGELTELGARYINARVVDDGQIITAAGITSSLELGIWLIERFIGQKRASEISELLEFAPREKVCESASSE